MKKVLIFILVFIFLMMFCGCGTVEESGSSAVISTDGDTTVTAYDFQGNIIGQWDNIRDAYGDEFEVHMYFNDGAYINLIDIPMVIIEEKGGQ